MALLASSIMDDAAAMLFDPNKVHFDYTRLLPYLKMANNELSDLLTLNNLQSFRTIAADKTVAAGAVHYTPLPDDFYLPIKMEEKAVGETDDKFARMGERKWEESKTVGTFIGDWVYRGNDIKFAPASVDRVVRLFYYRTITSITGQNSPIELDSAHRFLAARTAEVTAAYSGNNQVKADDLAVREVGPARSMLEAILVKNSQGLRTRRRSGTRRTLRRALNG